MLALPLNGSKVDTIGHHQGLLAQIDRKITSDHLSIPYHHLQLLHQQQTRTITQGFFRLGQISGTILFTNKLFSGIDGLRSHINWEKQARGVPKATRANG
jgi:hypothetical protein